MQIGLEMPMTMQQNEVLFFVDLSEVKTCSPVEALTQLQGMGHSPELRLYNWKGPDSEGVNPCALLHREISDDPESVFSSLEPVCRKLFDVFGEESVYLVMGTDD